LRTVHLNNVWEMRTADVLNLDFNKDGVKDHTMLMTKWASTELYMTYHSTNTKDRSLSSIISANPNAAHYAWGT
jgi:hypothetical protein